MSQRSYYRPSFNGKPTTITVNREALLRALLKHKAQAIDEHEKSVDDLVNRRARAHAKIIARLESVLRQLHLCPARLTDETWLKENDAKRDYGGRFELSVLCDLPASVEKFDSSEVDRLIGLLSVSSKSELKISSNSSYATYLTGNFKAPSTPSTTHSTRSTPPSPKRRRRVKPRAKRAKLVKRMKRNR